MEPARQRKLVFTGLDNSGKTSIIKSLENERFIKSELKPTTFIERSTFTFLDYEIVQHDLGGQQKYIIKYLEHPDKYFDNTDVCIYVIDVHEIARLGESLKYFEEVLDVFQRLGSHPRVYVFFHKAETALEGNLDAATRIETLQERISAINKDRFPLAFDVTTIYDPWTIKAAFSTIMHDLYPDRTLVEKTIKEMAGRLGADCLGVLDKRIIMLAHHASSPSQKEMIQLAAPYLFTFQSSMGRFKGAGGQARMKVEMEGYDLLFVEVGGKEKMYLIAMGGAGRLPGLDAASTEMQALLPELLAILALGR